MNRNDSRNDPGWWRRNRLGLLALPFLVAAAIGANGIRLDDLWWDTELRQATSGRQGDFVTFHQDYSDAVGPTSRTVRVRLDGIAEIEEYRSAVGKPMSIPDGADAYRIDLSFEAKPDQALQTCSLALEDDRGRRYGFDADFEGVVQDEIFPCLLFDSLGPTTPVFAGQSREVEPGVERPPGWQTHPVVIVPEGTRITRALMWWELPEYLSLTPR